MKTPDEKNDLHSRRKTRAQAPPLYPIFLQGTGKHALVVGAGGVGIRKIRQLLASNFKVTVVELNPSPELTELLAEQSQTLFFAGNSFESNSLAQALPQPVDLVFACTNQPEVNQAVAKWAKSVGALVNCADAPEASDFANGASFQVEGFTVVVSSNGRSPGEAAAFKARLQELLNGD